MKKTFPFHVPGKDDPRVLEAIKHDVRKYVKRERRKTVPEGFDLWQFDCRVGADQAEAVSTQLGSVSTEIDALAKTGAAGVYVEILASPGHRVPGLPADPAAQTPAPPSPPTAA